MERIHAGWLTKSPPEKNSQGPWKWFKSKWRRRYFVLYAAQRSFLSLTAAAECSAMLCYYCDEGMSDELGRIDLKHCQEIHTQLQTNDYRFVFALKTLHNEMERTYCLAADTQHDMNLWEKNLNSVLCLYDSGFQDQIMTWNLEQPDFSSILPKGVSAAKNQARNSRTLSIAPPKVSRSATEIHTSRPTKSGQASGGSISKGTKSKIRESIVSIVQKAAPRRPSVPNILDPATLKHLEGFSKATQPIDSSTQKSARKEGRFSFFPLFQNSPTFIQIESSQCGRSECSSLSGSEDDKLNGSPKSVGSFSDDLSLISAARNPELNLDPKGDTLSTSRSPSALYTWSSSRNVSLPPIPPRMEKLGSPQVKLNFSFPSTVRPDPLKWTMPVSVMNSKIKKDVQKSDSLAEYLKEMNESSENENSSPEYERPQFDYSEAANGGTDTVLDEQIDDDDHYDHLPPLIDNQNDAAYAGETAKEAAPSKPLFVVGEAYDDAAYDVLPAARKPEFYSRSVSNEDIYDMPKYPNKLENSLDSEHQEDFNFVSAFNGELSKRAPGNGGIDPDVRSRNEYRFSGISCLSEYDQGGFTQDNTYDYLPPLNTPGQAQMMERNIPDFQSAIARDVLNENNIAASEDFYQNLPIREREEEKLDENERGWTCSEQVLPVDFGEEAGRLSSEPTLSVENSESEQVQGKPTYCSVIIHISNTDGENDGRPAAQDANESCGIVGAAVGFSGLRLGSAVCDENALPTVAGSDSNTGVIPATSTLQADDLVGAAERTERNDEVISIKFTHHTRSFKRREHKTRKEMEPASSIRSTGISVQLKELSKSQASSPSTISSSADLSQCSTASEAAQATISHPLPSFSVNPTLSTTTPRKFWLNQSRLTWNDAHLNAGVAGLTAESKPVERAKSSRSSYRPPTLPKPKIRPSM